MRTPVRSFFLAAATASLAACGDAAFPTCQGPTVVAPDGACHANYYQADDGRSGKVTQVLVACRVQSGEAGGNVVAIHGNAHGIGLRWLQPGVLEVATAAGTVLQEQQLEARYLTHRLRYVYRTLGADEPAYRGCMADHAAGADAVHPQD